MRLHESNPRKAICGFASLTAIALSGLAFACSDTIQVSDDVQDNEAGQTEEVASGEQAVVYGTATQAHPEVAALPNQRCTATLIGSRDFLTTSRCINNAAQQRGGTISINYNTPQVQNYSIERILSLNGADLAVGRLTSAVPASVATPSTVCSSQLSPDYLTLMGYGCYVRGSSDYGTKRYTQYYYGGSGTTQNLCPGDFGGPLFRGLLSGTTCVARVSSAIGANPFPNDIFADPIANRTQVYAVKNALEANGVSYRAQLQGIGWQNPVTNSAMAGTTGQGRRLEALQVWSATPNVRVCYRSFVQNVAWQTEVCDGDVAGTVGAGLRMEAFTARLAARGPYSGIKYRAYLEGLGWQSWMYDGQLAGTTGQGRRIEAVQVQVY